MPSLNKSAPNGRRQRVAKIEGSMPAKKKPDMSTYSGRIGARIRTHREKAQMTVEQFRDALHRRGVNIAISTIYGIENGNRFVDVNHLPAIAAVLGCQSVLELMPPR